MRISHPPPPGHRHCHLESLPQGSDLRRSMCLPSGPGPCSPAGSPHGSGPGSADRSGPRSTDRSADLAAPHSPHDSAPFSTGGPGPGLSPHHSTGHSRSHGPCRTRSEAEGPTPALRRQRDRRAVVTKRRAAVCTTAPAGCRAPLIVLPGCDSIRPVSHCVSRTASLAWRRAVFCVPVLLTVLLV